jgi:type I restriction enzyme, S subunit
MTDWKVTTLDELAAPDRYSIVGGPFGSALGRKDYVDDGVPVIRGAQLGGSGSFSHHGLVFVSEEKADRHKGNLAFPGDIIVTQRGTVGQVGLIPSPAPHERYLLSQSQMKLSVDPSTADARFVYYWLLSPGAQHNIRGSTISAGVPHINLATFKGLRLRLPPLQMQRKISEVLSAIDGLIENNRRRVEALEEMARVIYREWFVYFRYPANQDSFVDSTLGRIPAGWEVKKLFDVADVGFGFSFKSKRFSETGPFPVIRIRDVPGGTTKTFSDEEAPDRYRVADGDVLIGMDGEFHLRQWTGGEAWLNQRVARLRPINGMAARHLMLALDDPIKEWNAAISGTTVAHLGKRHLEQIEVIVPDQHVLQRAARLFGDASSHICGLVQTSRRLATIRDQLLPKLVTGRIDVSSLDLDALKEGTVA